MKIQRFNIDSVTMDYCDGATDISSEEVNVFVETLPVRADLCKPVVYTTKHDEMNIFKTNIIDMNLDVIVESIIKESMPNMNFKLRSNTYLVNDPRISFQDLTRHINTFNKKVRETENKKSRMLATCKPVEMLLEDIKHTSLGSKGVPQIKKNIRSETGNDSKTGPKDSDKPHSSSKLRYRIIYIIQRKEADMYVFDNKLFVKDYETFRTDKYSDQVDIFHTLEDSKNILRVYCCCWHRRIEFINSLTSYPKETRKFMKKRHKCKKDCRCCCRNESVSHNIPTTTTTSMNTSIEKPFKTPSTLLKTITNRHKSITVLQISSSSLIPKSFIVPEASENNYRIHENVDILHSKNYMFEDECYQLGPNGQIQLFFRNNNKGSESNLIPGTANKIEEKICCWYKRERFADGLLKLGALSNTVNLIRNSHQCSISHCNCCCKPTSNKKINLLYSLDVRYTRDLVGEKVKINIRLPKIFKEPLKQCDYTAKIIPFSQLLSDHLWNGINKIRTKSMNQYNALVKDNDKMAHLIEKKSLNRPDYTIYQAEKIASIHDKNLSTEKDILKNPQKLINILNLTSKFHFIIEEKASGKIILTNANIKTLSKTELQVLDRIFHVAKARFSVKSNQARSNNAIKIVDNNETLSQTATVSTFHPNYSNVSGISKLRNKRFNPSVMAYTKIIPDFKNTCVSNSMSDINFCSVSSGISDLQ